MREVQGERDNYTRYPRAILWLVREGSALIGGAEPDAQPTVTNRQYDAFDPGRGRSTCAAGDDDPVTGVGHEQARAYCAWYAGVSRKPIRLPNEIEWEYACRAGATTRYCFGDDPARGDDQVWHAANSTDRLPPLKSKRPNRFGLIGMLGGVWEWTASSYRPYPLSGSERDEDRLAAGRPAVLRGGSFRVALGAMGCGVRRAAEPGMELSDVGFRIARSL